MLRGYLKVRENCPVCGEALHHHRADDGPAYLTILIVGHLMAPLIIYAFTTWRPDPLVLATVFSVGTVCAFALASSPVEGGDDRLAVGQADAWLRPPRGDTGE